MQDFSKYLRVTRTVYFRTCHNTLQWYATGIRHLPFSAAQERSPKVFQNVFLHLFFIFSPSDRHNSNYTHY